jgi:tetratricopeptide (TPR) repeat protein
MRGHRFYIALCALFLGLFPSWALSAGPDDLPGCRVPVFGGDKAAAVKACTSLLGQADTNNTSDEKRSQILKIRGIALHMSGNVDAAVQDFEKALKLTPKDTDLLVRLGMIVLIRREFDTSRLDDQTFTKAVDFAQEALAIDPNDSGAYVLIGEAASLSGNYGMAKVAYDKAVELKPDNIIARIDRFYFYKRVYAFDAALKELDGLLQMKTTQLDTMFTDIRSKEVTYRTLARLERAALFQTMGRFEEADKAYGDWVEIEPGPVSYGWRALFRMKRAQFDLAKADVEKALSYDPTFWFLNNIEANIYSATGEYERAIESFTKSIAQFPQSGLNYWGRAIALRAQKRTEEATRDALKALDDPDFPGRIIGRVKKSGYLNVSSTGKDANPALREAVRACMLDERC